MKKILILVAILSFYFGYYIKPTKKVFQTVWNRSTQQYEIENSPTLTAGETIEVEIKKEKTQQLPPGYCLLTNGKDYVWKDETGYMGIYTEKRMAKAIEKAWSFYRYERRDKSKDTKDNSLEKQIKERDDSGPWTPVPGLCGERRKKP